MGTRSTRGSRHPSPLYSTTTEISSAWRDRRAVLFIRASLCSMTEIFPDVPALPRLSLGTVITVGTFDGVHLGHRDLLARVARRAAELRLPSLLVTFDPPPLEVANPSAAPLLLSTTAEKLEA